MFGRARKYWLQVVHDDGAYIEPAFDCDFVVELDPDVANGSVEPRRIACDVERLPRCRRLDCSYVAFEVDTIAEESSLHGGRDHGVR